MPRPSRAFILRHAPCRVTRSARRRSRTRSRSCRSGWRDRSEADHPRVSTVKLRRPAVRYIRMRVTSLVVLAACHLEPSTPSATSACFGDTNPDVPIALVIEHGGWSGRNFPDVVLWRDGLVAIDGAYRCLLYTSDAADEED